MLKNILLIGSGGAIGSICRYIISVYIQKIFAHNFPLGTFAVNILGCFIVGLIFGLIEGHPQQHHLRLLFVIGFCGGFTTFSSFAYENIHLVQSGHNLSMLLYTLGSIVVGFIAVWAGLMISSK